MTAEELATSAGTEGAPPGGASVLEKTLWNAKVGNWDAAHELCQDVQGKAGDWIHAWLHRQEGDLGNAGYWYARAGRRMPAKELGIDEEWMEIASELLG